MIDPAIVASPAALARFEDIGHDNPRVNDGVPQPWPTRDHRLDPDDVGLRIFGQVARPAELGWIDLVHRPRTTVRASVTIGSTPIHRIWSGASLHALIAEAIPFGGARWLTVHAEGGYRQSYELDRLDGSIILADRVDGRRLGRSLGGPLRLIAPDLEPWRAAKWVRGLEVDSGA